MGNENLWVDLLDAIEDINYGFQASKDDSSSPGPYEITHHEFQNELEELTNGTNKGDIQWDSFIKATLDIKSGYIPKAIQKILPAVKVALDNKYDSSLNITISDDEGKYPPSSNIKYIMLKMDDCEQLSAVYDLASEGIRTSVLWEDVSNKLLTFEEFIEHICFTLLFMRLEGSIGRVLNSSPPNHR